MGSLNAERVGEITVGHRVIPDGVGHIGSDSDTVVVDAVGQILLGGFTGRRDRPQPIADEPQALGGRTVEGGCELAANLRFDGANAVSVERLGGGGHLGVVQAEFLLEADQLQQATRDTCQSVGPVVAGIPAVFGDGVKLVFEAENRLVVIEGAVAELR